MTELTSHKGRPKEYVGKVTYIAEEESLQAVTSAGRVYKLILWREKESRTRELLQGMKFAHPTYTFIIRPITFQLMNIAVDHKITRYGLYARKK